MGDKSPLTGDQSNSPPLAAEQRVHLKKILILSKK
jgi:hypothetical protein